MSLQAELSHFGINSQSKSVRWFRGRATPDLIDYLDLVEPRSSHDEDRVMPDGVAEAQERPLLYFINESRLAENRPTRKQQILQLQQTLACRGDRAYLAIVRPGAIDVAPVSLKERTPSWRTYSADSKESVTFFSRLALGQCDDFPSGAKVDFLFQEMFKLVDRTATRLDQLHLKRSDTISLVGRALFFRFLVDRNIVRPEDLGHIACKAEVLTECFDDAENAASTSAWLDKTFNGDFLPLTDSGNLGYFKSIGQRTGQRVFSHLSGIVRGDEPTGDDGFQLRLPIHWGHLNFAHIPVGLLSQIYERLSWKWDEHNARSTSVHYTPRNIAATLVGEAFDALPNAADARVLDPACGAGVFLVIAFRRLYHERWLKMQTRPDTLAIRSILEHQLVGFDISDPALKLCALSLYLTAIELDPNPAPPEKLKFKTLRSGNSAMLFDWRKPNDPLHGPVVGSVGRHVPRTFDRKFDLVLCNPPWTNIEKKYKAIAAELNNLSREIVSSLDSDVGIHYQNPDSVPDLPFLWRSLQWCKTDGRIAMALPARTLIKQGDVALAVRNALFQLVEITGIINGANLRKTKVWPDMDQPFMLLFARNRRSKASHCFHFISLHTDYCLNSFGETRIDSKSAQLVRVKDVIEEPWLLKALSVGTALDVEVVRKLKAASSLNLEDYWVRELKLSCRNGYQIKPNQQQRDATQLHILKKLDDPLLFRFQVDIDQLDYFDRPTLCWPRIETNKEDPLRVYRGPLALVKEFPGADRQHGWALFSEKDVAYNQSFYGYSSSGHVDAVFLAKYLQLFVHSKLWIHYALATSAKFGFERPNVYKEDLDQCPFIPIKDLTDRQRNFIEDYSTRLLNGDDSVFSDVDALFGELYGLNDLDLEVIKDTMEIREPNDELGIRASRIPSKKECSVFVKRLEKILKPLFKHFDCRPKTSWLGMAEDVESPFLVFTLGVHGLEVPAPDQIFHNAVIPLAYKTGATRIIQAADHSLVIGIMRQYRYWTPSRARMLAAEIIRHYLDIFHK